MTDKPIREQSALALLETHAKALEAENARLRAAALHAEAVMSIVEPRSDKAEYLQVLAEIRCALERPRARPETNTVGVAGPKPINDGKPTGRERQSIKGEPAKSGLTTQAGLAESPNNRRGAHETIGGDATMIPGGHLPNTGANPTVTRRGPHPVKTRVVDVLNEMREIAEDMYASNVTTEDEDRALDVIFDAVERRTAEKATGEQP